MDLPQALRDAIETQVIEHEPAQAALVLRNAVADLGAEEVTGGSARRRGGGAAPPGGRDRRGVRPGRAARPPGPRRAVPADNIDILARMLTLAASTAGGVRPPIDGVVAELGPERALFGAWLTTLSVIRVVSLSLERTEVEIAEEMVEAVDAFDI